MDKGKRDTIGIIFGGRSGEHEVSCLSAASVIRAIDKEKHRIKCYGIAKDGCWRALPEDGEDLAELIEKGEWVEKSKAFNMGRLKGEVDFALPIMHGPYCEDGKIQGLFEMLDIPYGGCGVLASAIAMDKIIAKDIFIKTGLPTCKYIYAKGETVKADMEKSLDKIEKAMGYPVFVKPANLGSSVGISKAVDRASLEKAILTAAKYDRRIIAEEFIDGRELETAVLGNQMPEVAEVGEILTDAEFYDYEAKYISVSGLKLAIPADISPEQREEIRRLAIKAYKAIDGEGFARVDFFMERATGKIYINEINTIPGFTKYSMFPLLWQKSGLDYSAVIERIIELGYERYYAKNSR